MLAGFETATIVGNLSEVMMLAQKAGVPRYAFLKFINSSPQRERSSTQPGPGRTEHPHVY